MRVEHQQLRSGQAMTGKNGWGLIGTGRIADERILPGINAFAGNELAGVVSRDAARAAEFARKFGARQAYTRYEDLLRDPSAAHGKAMQGLHWLPDKIGRALSMSQAKRCRQDQWRWPGYAGRCHPPNKKIRH